ncbi:hypothetical protein GCM10027290_00010 [Micromonospora sonneratiae]
MEITTSTEEGFGANVEFVEDHTLLDLDEHAIIDHYPRAYPHRYEHPVVFVVDTVALSEPEHPILVINLNAGVAVRPFRTTPRGVQSIENNLSISNMDFVEFTNATGADGIFRGF